MENGTRDHSPERGLAIFYAHVAAYFVVNVGLVITFGAGYWWWVPVVWGVLLVVYAAWLQHGVRQDRTAAPPDDRPKSTTDADRRWALGGTPPPPSTA